MNHWAFRVARSTVFSATAEILARAANTIFFILLTWFVSEAAAGRYSLGFVYSTLLLPLAFAGFEQLLTREAARNHEQAPGLLGNLLIARAAVSLLCYVGLLIWLALNPAYDQQTRVVVAIIAAVIVPESLINLYQGYLFAFERVGYIPLIGAITGICKLLSGMAVLAMGVGAVGAASVVLTTSILSFLIYSGIIARRLSPPCWRPDWHIWAQSFFPASSFFVIAVLLTLENMIGPLLLSFSYGPVAVGSYTAAATLINLLNILPISFRKAVLPLMSQAYTTTRKQAVRIMAQSLRLLLATTLFIAITASLLASPVLTLLYRGEFADATPVFIMLVWAFVFTTCSIPHGRMIVVANHQGRFILFHVASLLINLGLVLLLMPTMAVQAVALATLVSSAFIFVAGILYVLRYIERWPVDTVLRGPLIAGALMLAVAWTLHMLHVPLILAILPGWCVYGVVLWALRVFSVDDMRLLRQFIRRQQATVLDST